jgi:hypothetical protein
MRTIDRRLEKIERVAVIREPEIWLKLTEPDENAPKIEWDKFRESVAKAEAAGKNLIIIRII